MTEFAHLHLHTEYSLLDGMGTIAGYIEEGQRKGMRHLAVTDHGVMYPAMDWYNQLTAAGLHPIIGMEAYFSEGAAAPPPKDATDAERRRARKSYHLLLLAENQTGYRNLLKLASAASLEGYYYRPRVDRDMLASHSSGLIATSACLGGPVARNVLHENHDVARDYAGSLAEIFGRERFFIEIQDHGIADQHKVNPHLISLAKSFDLPLVATNDVHYCHQEDAASQEILVCVQTNSTLSDPKRLKMESDELYLKSPEEMADRFRDYPEAIANTIRIAEMCNLDLSPSGFQLPDFDTPPGISGHEYLRQTCIGGLRRRYGELTDEVMERLDYELSIIERMGLTNYFLVVWDFVRFAKENGILVGPGRGSSAGSIAAYGLGITALDPLKHGLIFERFLNPSRLSMPDFDIDFADDRRQEVIDYVVQKYGENRVAQITTFGTMAAKASVRDVGRAMGLPLSEVDRVARAIPSGPNVTIEKSLKSEPEFKRLYESEPHVTELVDNAKKVEGIARHASTHAAGVVISREPLIETVPLQRAGGKSEGEVTTQFPMGQLEALGLLKMDFLGLTMLTVIGKAVELANAKDPDLTVDTIPLEDPKAFELLRRGETLGIFQLEGGMATRMAVDIAPTRFEDIVALMALIRPGPMENAPSYIARRRGEEPITYMHPDLEPILEETYGIALYQEQIMQISNAIAGFSMADGDGLRSAIGKKKIQVMESYHDQFLAGAQEHGLSLQLAKDIWNMMEKFVGYGFPKAHSAAYAVIGAQNAFLKAHYPVEYLAALMSTDAGNSDRIGLDVAESRRLDIPVFGPSVNRSKLDFTVEDDNDGQQGIRIGLGAVKNVGIGAAEMIIGARAQLSSGEFSDLDDFCSTVDWKSVSKRVADSLAKAGALDEFGPRGEVLARLEPTIKSAVERQRAAERGQLGFDLLTTSVSEPTSRKTYDPDGDDSVTLNDKLAWEKDLLGVYVSAHPVAEALRIADVSGLRQIANLDVDNVGGTGRFVARIDSIRRMTTRNEKTMAIASIEDLTGSMDLVIFPDAYESYSDILEVDAVLELTGRIDRRNDRLQLICEHVSAELTPRRESSRTFHVYLRGSSSDDSEIELMHRVNAVLNGSDGDDEVVVHIAAAGKSYALHSRTRRVTADDDLVHAMESILGPDSAKVSDPALVEYQPAAR